MKASLRLTCVALVCSCIQVSAVVLTPGNLLSDPGFESGTPVPSGMGGWQVVNGALFSNPAHSGTWSLRAPCPASPSAASALQYVPATVGSDYQLSAWYYTPTTLPNNDIAYVYLLFVDASLNSVPNGSGIVTFVSGSPPGAWTHVTTDAVAPAGAVYALTVLAFDNFLSPSSDGSFVTFDDVALVQVPEPAFACFGILAAAGGWVLKRRRP
jgi:hypothetical protein